MHTSMRVATTIYKLGECNSNDIAEHTGLEVVIVRSILSYLARREIITSKPQEPITAKRLLACSISKKSLDNYKKNARCDTLDSEGVADKLDYLKKLKATHFDDIMLSTI